MHMFTLTLVYCEMVLHVVGTRRLQGFRRIPLSGPLQTLGPTQTLHPDLSPIKCGSICTWNSSCSGFSYQAGLDASGIGSQCWTGHFHPFYIPQSGDTEHNHPFWVAHYPEEGKTQLQQFQMAFVWSLELKQFKAFFKPSCTATILKDILVKMFW